MTKISIQPTKQTPEILLDFENLDFQIKGCSRPEDTENFYGPLIKSIEENRAMLQSAIEKLTIEVNIIYFNSSSLKFLLELFRSIIRYKHPDAIEINWHFEKDDEDVKEVGLEFSEALNIPVSFYES